MNITKNLKNQMDIEFSKENVLNKGTDGIKQLSNFKDLPEEVDVDEKWSQKYKDSIDCKNPKGFSQKAHCQGKKKKSENKEATGAGGAGGFEAPLFSKIESKEATGGGSSGSYESPAAWAKTTSKKDWRGASKTQIPGGKFVQVKKKCKKYPYCNQGDIKALNIFENQMVKRVISKISDKHNISEDIIKMVLIHELKSRINE